jgi:hypothetical protein
MGFPIKVEPKPPVENYHINTDTSLSSNVVDRFSDPAVVNGFQKNTCVDSIVCSPFNELNDSINAHEKYWRLQYSIMDSRHVAVLKLYKFYIPAALWPELGVVLHPQIAFICEF